MVHRRLVKARIPQLAERNDPVLADGYVRDLSVPWKGSGMLVGRKVAYVLTFRPINIHAGEDSGTERAWGARIGAVLGRLGHDSRAP